MFHILTGNNGATYVICCDSYKNINKGLNYYKPVNLLGKLKKIALFGVLWTLGKLNLKVLKSLEAVSTYCCDVIGKKIDFNLSENCSVFISPTRDKVIVNHHKQYFQKFAFGKSHFNVKNECEVYKLLNSSDSFLVSEISDIQNGHDYCSFKLTNPLTFSNDKALLKPKNLSQILIEFFNKVPLTFISWQDYTTGLKIKLQNSALCDAFVFDKVNKIALNDFRLPLGLVHRDFKPWNISYSNPPLIYDFEEALFNGPPLEDFFNFYIDPIIRHKGPYKVLSVINSVEITHVMNNYLEELNLNISREYLLITYCVERLLFYESRADKKTAIEYQNLLISI